jgi:hypothetical protein
MFFVRIRGCGNPPRFAKVKIYRVCVCVQKSHCLYTFLSIFIFCHAVPPQKLLIIKETNKGLLLLSFVSSREQVSHPIRSSLPKQCIAFLSPLSSITFTSPYPQHLPSPPLVPSMTQTAFVGGKQPGEAGAEQAPGPLGVCMLWP